MDRKFVSRAGEKLEFAVNAFKIDLTGLTTADFGCSTGGFTDCMLQHGAVRVYSVDTCYGELAYNLRYDERVKVFERNNAMHVTLPEKVDLLTIDVAWTRQEKVIPNALNNIKSDGKLLTLVKTNYEAQRKELKNAVVIEEFIPEILNRTEMLFESLNLIIIDKVKSPITGKRAGNEEWIYYLQVNN